MASNLPRPSTRTTSRCTPQTSRGTHAFEIAGYSLQRGLGAGHFIRSATFDVGGYSWCIRFYPDGYLAADDDEDNVAVFLELLSANAEARAHYDFRLVDLATGSSSSVSSTAVPLVFNTLDGSSREENSYAWGTDEFMERTELEASSYLQDDLLVVECDVTVIKEPLVVEENTVTSSSCHVAEVVPSSQELRRGMA